MAQVYTIGVEDKASGPSKTIADGLRGVAAAATAADTALQKMRPPKAATVANQFRGAKTRVDLFKGPATQVDEWAGAKTRVDQFRGAKTRADQFRGSPTLVDEHPRAFAQTGRGPNAAELGMQRDMNIMQAANAVQSIASAALNAAKAVASITFEFARAVVGAQEFKSNIMLSLNALLKSPQAAKEAYAQAASLSLKLGQSFEQGVGGFNQLIARGFDVTEAETAMRAVADLQVLSPTIDSGRIITALSQIKSKGRLQMEELQQQLGEAFDVGAVIDELAKKMGKTPDQVRDAIRAGKVDAETGLDAFFEAVKKKTGKGLGELAEQRANNTISGAAARTNNLKDQLLAGTKVDWTPMTAGLSKVVALMQSPRGQEFMDKLGNSLSRVVKALFGMFEGPEGDKKLISMLEMVEGTANAVASAFEKVGLAVSAILQVSAALDGMASSIGGLSTLVEGLWEGFINGALSVLTLGLSSVANVFLDLFNSLGPTFVDWGIQLGLNLLRGFAAVLTLGLSELGIAAYNAVNGAVGGKPAEVKQPDIQGIGQRAAGNATNNNQKTQNNNINITVNNNGQNAATGGDVAGDMIRNLNDAG